MKKAIVIAIIGFLIKFTTALAYDLNVIVHSETTHQKLVGLSVEAIHANHRKICDAIMQPDSTYFLRGLPNDTITISIITETKVIDKIVPCAVDSLLVEIPYDGMTRQLSEVVVEGDMQYIDNKKTTFIPATKVKKISAGGIALLKNIAIPSINVSPIDNSIKTISGEGVATFIDYLPASQNELENLRSMEVLRVEVYDYPKDPRFNGARYVVNFILRKYEYGGYTTLSGNQRFVDEQGAYNLSSKFAYKKMTYDVAIRGAYQDSKHVGGHSITNYEFPDEKVTREENTETGASKVRMLTSTFRAVYQTSKTVISNTIGLSSSRQPDCFRIDRTDFSSSLYTSGQTATNTDARNFSPTWNGTYQFFLPKNYSLVVNPSVSYGDISQEYAYKSGDNLIQNDVDESAWNYGISLTLQKRINQHAISFSLNGSGKNNELEYTGTTPTKVMTKQYNGSAGIDFNLGFNKVWTQGGVKFVYEYTDVNSHKKAELFPKYFVAAGYNFNSKNNISISSEMSNWTIGLSQKSDNMQYQNEIDAIQGNPELDSYLYNSVNLQYQWLPTNKFSMALFTRFERFSDPITYTYQPITNGARPIMLRQYTNDGFLNKLKYGGSAVLRLLNRDLTLSLGLSGESFSSHCAGNHISDNLLSFNSMIQYIRNGFWAQILYNSKSKAISTFSQIEIPQYYRMAMGWGNGDLNISVSVINPFCSSWDSVKTIISEPYYNYVATAYSGSYHRSFQILLSYSFSYGKKVNRTNAPSVSTVSSAILQ